MSPRSALLALLLALPLAAPLRPARAQELSLSGFGGASGNKEFHTPRGGRVALTFFPAAQVGVRLSYGVTWASNRYPGTTCDVYWPIDSNCVSEPLDSRTRAQTLGYGLVLRPRPARTWSSTFALELTNTSIRRFELRGVNTGRSAGAVLYQESTGLIDHVAPTGAGVDVSVRRRLRGRLALEAGAAVRTFSVGRPATDVYQPFLHTTLIGELHAGMVIGPGR